MRSEASRKRTLRRKLESLIECVLAKAEEDSEFARRLEQILHGEAPQKGPAEVQRPHDMLNPVLFLKDHGEEALSAMLSTQTDGDLRSILRFQGLRRGKELKKLPRQEMLREIESGAKAKLKQGLVVARVGLGESSQDINATKKGPENSPSVELKTEAVTEPSKEVSGGAQIDNAGVTSRS